MPLLATSADRRPDVLDPRALRTHPDRRGSSFRPQWFARRRSLRRLDAPVIAVLRDRLDDVTVASCAGHRARRERRQLVLVIPLPAGTTSTWDDATAIAARVRPELDRLELDRLGLRARTAVAWYADSPDPGRRERRALAAADRTARRLRGDVVLSAAPQLSWSAQPDPAVPNDRHRTAREVDQLPIATLH